MGRETGLAAAGRPTQGSRLSQALQPAKAPGDMTLRWDPGPAQRDWASLVPPTAGSTQIMS